MENRDNLERFIKKQIDSIEVNESDKMWEKFQMQYELPKRKYNFIFWGCFFVGVCVVGYLTFGNYLNNSTEYPKQQNLTELNVSEKESTKNEIETRVLIDAENKTTKNVGDQISNENFEKKKNTKTTNKVASLIDSNNKLKNQLNSNFKIENFSIDETNKNTKTQTTDLRNQQIEEANTDKTIENQTENDVQKRITNNSTSNQTNKTSFNSLKQTNETLSNDKTTVSQKSTINKLAKVSEITGIRLSPLDIPARIIDTLILNLKEQNVENQWFIAYEPSMSLNQIYQHNVGLGYHIPIKNNNGFELFGGFRYGEGYSLSLDTINITRGVSIVENRKDKDLDYLVDFHLSGAYTYKIKRLQFAIGGKANYGVRNQYLIKEKQTIVHDEFFNFTQGTSVATYNKINDWAALNRLRFDVIAKVSYQLYDWEIGFTASKPINTLIKDEMAAKNKSNAPVQFGLQLKHNF